MALECDLVKSMKEEKAIPETISVNELLGSSFNSKKEDMPKY